LQITQTIKQDFLEFELAPKHVAAAAAKLPAFQKEWERLNRILENSKKIRSDTP
jgi:hypothetical protein